MPIASMTGFARAEGEHLGLLWTWEIKSVNGKGLDVRCRLPGGLDGVEGAARAAVAARLKRGNVSANLSFVRPASGGAVTVNREALDRLLAVAEDLRRRLPDCAPPSIDGLLGLKGVLEVVEEQPDEVHRQALEKAILAGLDGALDRLALVRAEEGARLAAVLDGHLTAIDELCAEATGAAATQGEAIKARLFAQVRELLGAVPALPEERLAQEAALLLLKADVREELDRLASHIAAARALMAEGVNVGRRFDFLCQEFNREANTLCSKAAGGELTRIGLALKATIDQLREQVQNIE